MTENQINAVEIAKELIEETRGLLAGTDDLMSFINGRHAVFYERGEPLDLCVRRSAGYQGYPDHSDDYVAFYLPFGGHDLWDSDCFGVADAESWAEGKGLVIPPELKAEMDSVGEDEYEYWRDDFQEWALLHAREEIRKNFEERLNEGETLENFTQQVEDWIAKVESWDE